MRRVFVAASGLCDWQARLADPELHWKRGRSAFELAVTWEVAAKTARGLPAQVAALLDQHNATCDATLLLAVPEHKVALDGNGKPSQTDVWAVLNNQSGLMSLAVEGKAGEPLDKTVGQWRGDTDNRRKRLEGLCQTLGLSITHVDDLRYQLLHRAASAVLEAKRFGAQQAILLVQSFGNAGVGFGDFNTLAERMGVTGIGRGQLVPVQSLGGLQLWLGWLGCPFVTDAEIAQAAT